MGNERTQQKLQELTGCVVKFNEEMSLHTSFRIGGPADYYSEVDSIDVFVKLVKAAKQLLLPVVVIGQGTNILVSDKGIEGVVIKNNCRKFEVAGMQGRVKDRKLTFDKAHVLAESGAIMNQLVRFTLDQGMQGLEYHLGLPGTVGGAVFMNSNFPKKGVHVGDSLHKTKLLTLSGEVKEVDASYFRFAYDHSILQQTHEIVLSVIFKFLPEDKESLWEKGNEALNYRLSTQPKGASAGCSFRNISIVEALQAITPGGETSAGYLIDKAGLKGKRVGNAMVSLLHANYIMNMGDAKAEDVVNLVAVIKEEVLRKFKVHLQLEVLIIGRE